MLRLRGRRYAARLAQNQLNYYARGSRISVCYFRTTTAFDCVCTKTFITLNTTRDCSAGITGGTTRGAVTTLMNYYYKCVGKKNEKINGRATRARDPGCLSRAKTTNKNVRCLSRAVCDETCDWNTVEIVPADV